MASRIDRAPLVGLNLTLTVVPLSSRPELVVALAAVKEAAAPAHREPGALPEE
ncbi:hypothetical protein [Streptomyces tritici]|uniref:hypothetical protein n=1 Tax=Streptomyces tritici TaxID=2054410 RepID=UPI003AF14C14